MKDNKKSISIVCLEINTKYRHHRRLIIGKKYYTHNFIEGESIGCNVYSEETCANESFVGTYWTRMFLCISSHRERQIDSIFKD
jgi:hypothetical protein